MTLELRYATDDEFDAVCDLDGAAFGFHYDVEARADARLDVDPGRILVATDDVGIDGGSIHGGSIDGPGIVGVSAEVPFLMNVPGGTDVPVTGLTWVSVAVTHRRRGVLSALTRRQITTRAAAGDAALVLSAAEGGIYGRFGFGVATHKRHSVVRRRRARPANEVDAGDVRLLDTDRARASLPDLHERWRVQTPGGLRRDAARWEFMLLDRPYQQQGRSGLFHLVHPDGYVSYRVRSDWGEGDPQHQIWITDYAPITPAAHAALWQTLLATDLVGTIESYQIPLDDPLELVLADPRGTETSHLGDDLWIRPLDVARLLAARRYATDIDCVLGVRDQILGDERYHLRGGPDGAICSRTDRPAQLGLDVAGVGAVSLGGTRLNRLVRAGLVDVHDAVGSQIAQWDAALHADREPVPGTVF